MSQTLDRALSILDQVAQGPQRINDVAAALDVHPSTALRLLHTLRKHGFVRELDGHVYRLGPATFRLGFKALEELDLRAVARPFMDELSDKTGETVHLGAMQDGGDVVYIDKVDARHPVRMYSRVGATAPIHCTGVAKAILASLPPAEREQLIGGRELTGFTEHTFTTPESLEEELARSRERGFAMDNEEHEIGIHCVAAPIIRGDGQVAGGISVSAPTSRVDKEQLKSFAPLVMDAARKSSEELGWSAS